VQADRWVRILGFPLIRMVIGAVLVVAPVIAVHAAVPVLPLPVAAAQALAALGSAAAALLGYCAYVRWIERRALTELSRPAALRELGGGLMTGAALFSITIGILAVLGVYRVAGCGNVMAGVVALAAATSAGVVEELVFRGVLFRTVEAALGSWWALAVSAVVFGVIHLLNRHATLQGALAIILEAGVLLAAAYLLTRRLWFCIGTHIAWNFVQGGVFGVAVSGSTSTGLLRGELSGPIWLSGGEFGAEASVVAIAVCLLAAAGFLLCAVRRHRICRPGAPLRERPPSVDR
jgi:membrane protease YdiL (CAAX protease family)